MADKAKKSQMFAVLASGWWLFPNRMAVWGKIIQTKHTKSFLWRQRWPTWLQDGNVQTGNGQKARGEGPRVSRCIIMLFQDLPSAAAGFLQTVSYIKLTSRVSGLFLRVCIDASAFSH